MFLSFGNLFVLLIFALFSHPVFAEEPRPKFAFSWLNDNNTFTAGDVATIKVIVFADNLDVFAKNPLNLSLTVNGKVGNSTYVSGVSSSLTGDSESWFISFIPISTGVFNVIISDDIYKVLDSSLHFEAVAGLVDTAACVASWMGLVSDFEAGATATVLILPRDSFGNNVSSTAEVAGLFGFTVSAFYLNGSMASLFNVNHMGWHLLGYFSVEFTVIKAGDFLLHVEGGNQTLDGSPLAFKVYPGPLAVASCVAEWSLGTKVLQIFSKMELFIYQNDRYGNLVQGWYAFDAQVVEKGTKLSIPVPDLIFEEVVPGIQLLSSSVLEPGDFLLTIYNLEHNTSIAGMPFDFTVYVGYCDGVTSVINGSSLENSAAGEIEKFSVHLKDKYQYPSPVELDILRVQILRETDFLPVWPAIVPLDTVNGTISLWSATQTAPVSAPYTHQDNSSGGSVALQATSFDVTFKPEKSGLYGIHVFCGNIPLNGGHRLTKEVTAGEVDISRSGVVQFEPKVSKLRKIKILVQVMDFYLNPIEAQESKLKLDVSSANGSKSETWIFADNGNGSYAGFYMVRDAGTYELCVSFDGKQFQPCPFHVNVYGGEYFPRATIDQVSVWEDESIAFDILSNDYFAGQNASIVNISKPAHGTLLQYAHLFRYTPFKGYSGNDSFTYTIVDVNDNVATGSINISVLIVPPQFASSELLYATEEIITPKFGGFPGFEIKYSDQSENISVTLHANSGTILLSPMLMQFGQPMWTGLIVLNMGDGTAADLTLTGNVQAINIALQSIQYLGNENFSGEDTILLSTRNKNGINNVKVAVLVEPVNDPPFIRVPDYVILKQVSNAAQIFNSDSNKSQFIIGDPDVLNFPGGESRFFVMFSVEVSTGFLETKLPAELINTTELKLRKNYHWQPLLNFVTISEHFTVKAKGIRFRGTFYHCREIMEQLLYHGGDHAAILTLTVNDLGNYGCYEDCIEKLSKPLFTEATIKLVRRKPMSSLAAKAFGSAIICEFIAVSVLGIVLLFYTCKCAKALSIERSSNLSTHTSSSVNLNNRQDQTTLTGKQGNPILLRRVLHLHHTTVELLPAMASNLLKIGTKIICVGRNYAAHAKELGNAVPKEPVLFMKPTSSYLENGGTIEIPEPYESLDHEVELAVVIGKKARDVPKANAMDYVGGYALALDMTARELQSVAKSAGLPWTMAKGQDTFTPIGSVLSIATVPDPHNLELWLKVDGELRQKGSTADMIFPIPYLISHITSYMTLFEGDVILTGTPKGVGPVKAGQKVTAGITNLVDVHFNVSKRQRPSA